MAKLTEIERWEEEIYRIEENDPVHGGENGITNKPTKQLANRTRFLRKQLQLAGQKLVPKKLTSTTRNLADETGHTHEIERASLTQAGITQLSASIQSTSTSEAATPSAVKRAYDKATEANDKVDAVAVGATNLLLNSDVPYSGSAYRVQYSLAEAPALGEEVVITLWGELGAQRTGIGVYNTHGYSEIARLTKLRDGVYQGKGVWRKPVVNNQEQTPNDTHLSVYFYPSSATDNNRINRIQLERGNIGTDWKPNREDIKSDVQKETRTKFITVRGGSQAVTLDAAKRSDWFREMQIPVSGGWGYYVQAFHNSGEQHVYSNFPLTGRYYFTAEVFHSAGFSHIRVTYPSLKRVFETQVNFNQEALTPDWREVVLVKNGVFQGTFKAGSALEAGYRVRIERNDASFYPYTQMLDASVNVAQPITAGKVIGEMAMGVKEGANDRHKAVFKTGIMTDGNVFTELGQWNAENRYQVPWKSFSKTNNTAIGKTTDNGRDRLQVNGTIQATAPAANANNDQLPTTAWVNAKFAEINMKSTAVSFAAYSLNATSRADWVAQLGIGNYGVYTRSFYGKNTTRVLSNFPIETSAYFQATLTHQGAHSILRIQYPSLNRIFESAIDMNKETFTLNWHEIAVLAKHSITGNGYHHFNRILQVGKSSWQRLHFPVIKANEQFVLEANPNADSNDPSTVRMNLLYQVYDPQTKQNSQKYLSFPQWGDKNEVVAYRSWVAEQGNSKVSKSGDTMTGALKTRHIGKGRYVDQYLTDAPFLIEAVNDSRGDTFHPFIKGKMRSHNDHGASFSFGWTSAQSGGSEFGRGVIAFVGDNGNINPEQVKLWRFEPNGDFVSGGNVITSLGHSLNNAVMTANGDLTPLWSGVWHSIAASGATITLTQDFKRFRYLLVLISDDAQSYINQAFLRTEPMIQGQVWNFGSNNLYWTARIESGTVLRNVQENCVLRAIYGVQSLV